MQSVYYKPKDMTGKGLFIHVILCLIIYKHIMKLACHLHYLGARCKDEQSLQNIHQTKSGLNNININGCLFLTIESFRLI